MKNIESAKVNVFPAVNRAEKYSSGSCLLTENNLTKFLRYIYPADDCSFVNTCDFNNNKLVLIIYGYLFDINFTFSADDKKNLYACIFTKNNKLCTKDGDETSILDNTENTENIFEGIYFANSLADLPPASPISDKHTLTIIKNNVINNEQYSFKNLKTEAGIISPKNIMTECTLSVSTIDKENTTNKTLVIDLAKTKGKDN